MKKTVMILGLVGALALSSSAALAQNIKGKLGVTGLLGFNIPTDSDYNDLKVETDAGFIGGGGFIYGIDKNWTAEMDITHTWFGSNRVSGPNMGDFEVTNIALGGQYRFAVDVPNLTPYAGAGLDILLSDYKDQLGINRDVDTTVGAHVSGGVDYFLTRNLALTAEARAVIAPETSINSPGGGHFDPSSFSGLFGARFFFN